ncbi:MAG: dTDP-4-dehydrorhamnose reductase [Pseudomonadota bacterium]
MNSGKKSIVGLVLGGKTGLLGRALAEVLRAAGWEIDAPGRDELEVGDLSALEGRLAGTGPDFVFNAVGYTKVDQAEDEPEQAMALNRDLPAALGRLSLIHGFGLVHYSTDYVFDGKKQSPYEPVDLPNPLSFYGLTKLAGERAVLEANPGNSWLIRSAWLFGPGRANFVTKIIAAARERGEVRVVADQTGSPTHTLDLARLSLDLVQLGAPGVYHVVNDGRATWHELAAAAIGLAGIEARVVPIETGQYPVKAVRPAFSVLGVDRLSRVLGRRPRPWREALAGYVASLG